MGGGGIGRWNGWRWNGWRADGRRHGAVVAAWVAAAAWVVVAAVEWGGAVVAVVVAWVAVVAAAVWVVEVAAVRRHGRRHVRHPRQARDHSAGELANGLGFFFHHRFSYLGSDQAYVGVMAQEVEAVRPEAIVRHGDGYLRVDYDKLGFPMQTYEEWVAAGERIPTPSLH